MRAIRRVPVAVFRLFVAVCVAVFAFAALAERVEDLPKPTNYVSDYAHVLSPEAIARLNNFCAQLDHSKANAQIAVVTIHTLGGEDSASYATRLFEKMKIGAKGTDRGVLFLFAIDDHRRSIKIGYGLEGILPDAKTGDVGRDMVPYLRANDFDGAVTLGVNEVAQVIAADAKVTLDAEVLPLQMPPPPDLTQDEPWSLGKKIAGILFLTFVILIVLSPWILTLLISRGCFKRWGWTLPRGSGRRGDSGGGGSGGGTDSGGDSGGGDSGGSDFGGFDGGDTGGGGSDGSW
jgi:uncharacterized protein